MQLAHNQGRGFRLKKKREQSNRHALYCSGFPNFPTARAALSPRQKPATFESKTAWLALESQLKRVGVALATCAH